MAAQRWWFEQCHFRPAVMPKSLENQIAKGFRVDKPYWKYCIAWKCENTVLLRSWRKWHLSGRSQKQGSRIVAKWRSWTTTALSPFFKQHAGRCLLTIAIDRLPANFTKYWRQLTISSNSDNIMGDGLFGFNILRGTDNHSEHESIAPLMERLPCIEWNELFFPLNQDLYFNSSQVMKNDVWRSGACGKNMTNRMPCHVTFH